MKVRLVVTNQYNQAVSAPIEVVEGRTLRQMADEMLTQVDNSGWSFETDQGDFVIIPGDALRGSFIFIEEVAE